MVTGQLGLHLGSPWLGALAEAGHEEASSAVAAELDRVAAILRLPCRYRVTIHPRPDLRLFRLDGSAGRVHADAGLARRLGAPPGRQLPEGPPAEGLAALAGAVATLNPWILLSPEVVDRWWSSGGGYGKGPEDRSSLAPGDAASLARALVARGIALPDPARIFGWLREAGPGEDPARWEWILSRAAPGRIRLELAPDLARELGVEGEEVREAGARTSGERWGPILEVARDQMLLDPGLRLPPEAETVVEPGLPPRRFRVVLTDLPLPVWKALGADQHLAGVSAAAASGRLAWSETLLHPLLPVEMPLLEGSEARRATDAGLPLLDRTAHMALCVLADLRRQAAVLVHLAAVLDELRRVQRSIPTLVDVALREVGAVALTRILRELVRAGLPIRDLRGILDAALSWERVEVDTEGVIILDSRPLVEPALLPTWADEPVQRSWMARRAVLGPVVAPPGGPGSLPFIRLDQESVVEPLRRDLQILARTDRLEGEGLDRMEAIREELRALSGSWTGEGDIPVLVAEEPLAPWLRRELGTEFPWLKVLAYTELPPYTRLVPHTVVSL